jgi:hypothetical protein
VQCSTTLLRRDREVDVLGFSDREPTQDGVAVFATACNTNVPEVGAVAKVQVGTEMIGLPVAIRPTGE